MEQPLLNHLDVLCHLLGLTQMQLRLDARCLLAGSFELNNTAAPPGEAAFHLVLAGACRFQAQDGTRLTLAAGDFVLLPHGDAHTLGAHHPAHRPAQYPADPVVHHRGCRAAADAESRHPVRPVEPVPGSAQGGGVPLHSNLPPEQSADAAEVDVLCGRFVGARGGAALLSSALPPLLRVSLDGTEGLLALARLLRSEGGQAGPGAQVIVNALGQALLALVLRAATRGGAAHPLPVGVLALLADERLAPSLRAMLDGPDRDWTIASLGAVVGMSRATYARHFAQASGSTVGEVLHSIRMMRACRLLGHTRRGLADIAGSVGYRSETAFSKAFARTVGVPPARWRAQNPG